MGSTPWGPTNRTRGEGLMHQAFRIHGKMAHHKCPELVAQDEEDAQEILVYTLRRHGFEVFVTSDGAGGRPLILSTTPGHTLSRPR
ncbi:MAG: hypothetical protein OSB42_03755 [Planctomycetota bacterium]|nr:hypothetical protein [Planctomycetota bacterium]